MEIKKGVNYLNSLNSYNYTQGLIIRNNKVIAKETSKGTKKMLHAITKKNNTGGMLIKFPKKKQDLRVDLPTIGLETFKDCIKIGIKGIVLKSNENIILDKIKCINFANKNKMFVSVR